MSVLQVHGLRSGYGRIEALHGIYCKPAAS